MIDFGKTTRDYAKYRVPFTPGLFDRLRDHGIGAAAQRILDVGAGTGLLGERRWRITAASSHRSTSAMTSFVLQQLMALVYSTSR